MVGGRVEDFAAFWRWCRAHEASALGEVRVAPLMRGRWLWASWRLSRSRCWAPAAAATCARRFAEPWPTPWQREALLHQFVRLLRGLPPGQGPLVWRRVLDHAGRYRRLMIEGRRRCLSALLLEHNARWIALHPEAFLRDAGGRFASGGPPPERAHLVRWLTTVPRGRHLPLDPARVSGGTWGQCLASMLAEHPHARAWERFLEDFPLLLRVSLRWRVLVTVLSHGRSCGLRMRVRRGTEVEDALALASDRVDLRLATLHVAFDDPWGNPEAGVDAGGIRREFFERFWARVVECGFLVPAPAGGLEPCAHDVGPQLPDGWRGLAEGRTAEQLLFRFLGRMCATCVREEVPLPRLSLCALRGLLGHPPLAEPGAALAEHDPALASSLLALRADSVEQLQLPCSATVRRFGEPPWDQPLWPGGCSEVVTAQTLPRYLEAMALWHAAGRFGPRLSCMSEGFHTVVSRAEVSDRFSVDEFQQLFTCSEGAPTVQDLRPLLLHKCAPEGQPQGFWRALESLQQADASTVERLLRFVTGTGSLTDTGVVTLQTPLTVHWLCDDHNRMPSASTCANTLYVSARYDGGLRQALRRVLFELSDADLGFQLL